MASCWRPDDRAAWASYTRPRMMLDISPRVCYLAGLSTGMASDRASRNRRGHIRQPAARHDAAGLSWPSPPPAPSEGNRMATIPEIEARLHALWTKGEARTGEESVELGRRLAALEAEMPP